MLGGMVVTGVVGVVTPLDFPDIQLGGESMTDEANDIRRSFISE
jgi:hypothetical protein